MSDRISLSMRTDEDTFERFTLKVDKRKSAASLFLMKGEPFVEKDWAKIEAAKGKLLPRMRATVWVCEGGANPVVDWRPPRE